jgi:hypothetical protein
MDTILKRILWVVGGIFCLVSTYLYITNDYINKNKMFPWNNGYVVPKSPESGHIVFLPIIVLLWLAYYTLSTAYYWE